MLSAAEYDVGLNAAEQSRQCTLFSFCGDVKCFQRTTLANKRTDAAGRPLVTDPPSPMTGHQLTHLHRKEEGQRTHPPQNENEEGQPTHLQKEEWEASLPITAEGRVDPRRTPPTWCSEPLTTSNGPRGERIAASGIPAAVDVLVVGHVIRRGTRLADWRTSSSAGSPRGASTHTHTHTHTRRPEKSRVSYDPPNGALLNRVLNLAGQSGRLQAQPTAHQDAFQQGR